MKLRVEIEDQSNADSFQVKYKYDDETQWNVFTVTTFPYDIKGIEPNRPIILKIKKNCKTKPCSSVGAVGYTFVD